MKPRPRRQEVVRRQERADLSEIAAMTRVAREVVALHRSLAKAEAEADEDDLEDEDDEAF